ncbi:MAG: hypothetical protein V7719_06550 [Psychroserpens sp.]|uniref:hypothetical protein n=1 Tax=Psychroserpens sp. TaxID=2020870 RepID=UPI003001B321
MKNRVRIFFITGKDFALSQKQDTEIIELIGLALFNKAMVYIKTHKTYFDY